MRRRFHNNKRVIAKQTIIAWFVRGLVSAAVMWTTCSAACAQTRKKKEAPPGIAERGKLLFEDDFSEKELLWTFDPSAGEWGIVKKTLLTKSIRGAGKGYKWSSISRQFTPSENVILEMKALLPSDSAVTLSVSFTGPAPAAPREAPAPPGRGTIRGCITPDEKTMRLQFYKRGEGSEQLAVGAFPYTKRKWVALLFEVFEDKYALTVEGRTIKWVQVGDEKRQKSEVHVALWTTKELQDVVAIDDVSVWEALPKDEEEEKGKERKN
ncbi:MAG: hypothetical protein AB1696_26595 [Planctomycetota bacterium]